MAFSGKKVIFAGTRYKDEEVFDINDICGTGPDGLGTTDKRA